MQLPDLIELPDWMQLPECPVCQKGVKMCYAHIIRGSDEEFGEFEGRKYATYEAVGKTYVHKDRTECHVSLKAKRSVDSLVSV